MCFETVTSMRKERRHMLSRLEIISPTPTAHNTIDPNEKKHDTGEIRHIGLQDIEPLQAMLPPTAGSQPDQGRGHGYAEDKHLDKTTHHT